MTSHRPRHRAARTDRTSGSRVAGRAVGRSILIALITIATTNCSGPARSGAPEQSPAPSASPSSPAASASTAASPPTPTPTPTQVQVAHLAKSKPVRLQIPAIGVDSPLMDLGLKSDGTMQVPPAGFPAGWYTGAPTPGEVGPAIIAGHVDWNGPAVFYRLRDLKPGDTVSVTREDGIVAVFRVTQVQQFAKNAFPTALVYGNIAVPGLRLITCGGSWNTTTHHYNDNIIAFADLVASGS